MVAAVEEVDAEVVAVGQIGAHADAEPVFAGCGTSDHGEGHVGTPPGVVVVRVAVFQVDLVHAADGCEVAAAEKDQLLFIRYLPFLCMVLGEIEQSFRGGKDGLLPGIGGFFRKFNLLRCGYFCIPDSVCVGEATAARKTFGRPDFVLGPQMGEKILKLRRCGKKSHIIPPLCKWYLPSL